jgi:hypothetical protein
MCYHFIFKSFITEKVFVFSNFFYKKVKKQIEILIIRFDVIACFSLLCTEKKRGVTSACFVWKATQVWFVKSTFLFDNICFDCFSTNKDFKLCWRYKSSLIENSFFEWERKIKRVDDCSVLLCCWKKRKTKHFSVVWISFVVVVKRLRSASYFDENVFSKMTRMQMRGFRLKCEVSN